jgi:hypothetical protein
MFIEIIGAISRLSVSPTHASPHFSHIFFPEKALRILKYYRQSREINGCTFAIENGQGTAKWDTFCRGTDARTDGHTPSKKSAKEPLFVSLTRECMVCSLDFLGLGTFTCLGGSFGVVEGIAGGGGKYSSA